jgi:hypothetical protein
MHSACCRRRCCDPVIRCGHGDTHDELLLVHVVERSVPDVCSGNIQDGLFHERSFHSGHCYANHTQHNDDNIRHYNAPKSWEASEAALVEVTAFAHNGGNEAESDLALVAGLVVAMEEERRCDCSKDHLDNTPACGWRIGCRAELQQEVGVRARAAHATSQNADGLALWSG